MSKNIVLDPDDAKWRVTGRRVEILGEVAHETYTLPKGCRRVVVQSAGRHRSQLVLGGFSSTTVTVTGPSYVIKRLRDEVL